MTVTDTWAVCKNTGPRALIYTEAPRGLEQEAQDKVEHLEQVLSLGVPGFDTWL